MMKTIATFATLTASLLWSCSDPVQTASYPILLKPIRVENVSSLKSVVPDGDRWEETESDSVGLNITNRIDFTTQVFDSDFSIELMTDTQWRIANDTTTFAFERNGDIYELVDTLRSIRYFAIGNNHQMRVTMTGALVQGNDENGTPRTSIYRYSHRPNSTFDLPYPPALFQSSDTFIIERVDYKTFDMLYQAE